MKKQVTPWFKCSKHKPTRKGWYDWNHTRSEKFPTVWRQYWDGQYWRATQSTMPYFWDEQRYGYWRGVKK